MEEGISGLAGMAVDIQPTYWAAWYNATMDLELNCKRSEAEATTTVSLTRWVAA